MITTTFKHFIISTLNIPPLQVSCGENHTAALSVDGRLFTWGRGKYGQLGHGDFKNISFPEHVKALSGAQILQVEGMKDFFRVTYK